MEIPPKYRGNDFVIIYQLQSGRYEAAYYDTVEGLLKRDNNRQSMGDRLVTTFREVNFDFFVAAERHAA